MPTDQKRRVVTLGILGTGPLTHNLVCDSLNDQFAYGPPDQEGFFAPSEKYDLHVYIPAGAGHTGEGTRVFWGWTTLCELSYTALHDETRNQFTGDILADGEDAEGPDVFETHTVQDIGAAMVDYLSQGENPMLLLISTDGVFDPAAADAAAAALRAGIPCYDLARALLEITWRHLPDHEPPAEEVLAVEEDGQVCIRIADLVSDRAPVTLTGAEADAVSNVLSGGERFLVALREDVIERIDRVQQSFVFGRSLLASKPEASTPVGEEMPKKTRLEIFNPETNAWEPAGRGRPPKNAQTRRVSA